jgi:hypothetical protein
MQDIDDTDSWEKPGNRSRLFTEPIMNSHASVQPGGYELLVGALLAEKPTE